MEFNFISSQEALIDKRLLEEISILYNQSFPDVNEREDFYTVLLPRIDSDLIPTTKMTVAKIGDKVAGCAFIDYYQEINTGHLIYIFINPELRGQGYGTKLLNHLLEEYEYLFIEVDDPNKVNEELIPLCNKRISFYKQFNFKYLSREYRQPPINPDTGWCDTLALAAVGKTDKITNETLQTFLSHFYDALDQTYMYNTYKMINE